MLHIPLIHPDLMVAHEYMLDACFVFLFRSLINESEPFSEADTRSAAHEIVLA
jgi:hypothetical protein